MVDWGGKLSKNGYGYDDGDRHLILNTKYPMLKIKTLGSGTITLSSGSGTKTLYTHNLGYKPMFYVFINYVNINTGSEIEKLRMCSWREYYGLGIWSRYYAYATTNTIELSVYTVYSGSETLDYIYVVYYDPIS